MRKKLVGIGIALALMAGTSMTAYAGQWQQDATGWWWQNDDGSYLKDGWSWIDGKCYYFTPQGYCLTGTQTPDGYTVDASGAWTVDGVVQVQQTEGPAAGTGQEEVMIDSLTFTVPAGYSISSQEEGSVYYANADSTIVIGIMSESLDFEGHEDLVNAYQESLLDETMQEVSGMQADKSVKQLSSGTWYCYRYPENAVAGIPGSMCAYARINGSKLQMVLFAGAISGMDTDGVMNSSIR